jgi:twitching motility protein PilU
MEREQAISYMRDLLTVMVNKKSSDLFITVDFPAAIKIDGKITPVSKTRLNPDDTRALAYAVMNDRPLSLQRLYSHGLRRSGIARHRNPGAQS